jgi:hypothetical protein
MIVLGGNTMTFSEEKYPEVSRSIKTRRAALQFIFPFYLIEEKIEEFVKQMLKEDFVFFNLKDSDLETQFYGKIKVRHRSLESYFMPNIEPILFPESYRDKEGFRRFSKKIDSSCEFISPHLKTDFTINSLDVYICPFHIGIMNIRVTLPENLEYSDVLSFAETFRVLEPISEDKENTKIISKGKTHSMVKDFIFNELLPIMKEYVHENDMESSYFGSLPFFVDERMYVVGHITLPTDATITKTDLYRAGQLNGYDETGNPYIGALNPTYIEKYYEQQVYDRWATETFYVTSEYHFVCITKSEGKVEEKLASQMYGDHYYAMLLFYYYKIVLLKLSHDHSKIDVENDQAETELLIIMINQFSAKYFFYEVNSTTTGKELFHMIRKLFRIDPLYLEVKETLADLYQSQEKMSTNRLNYLLQILTIYTVVSGIFGMNLVIEDLKEGFKWSNVSKYTFFEYFVLIVMLSGIIISSVLGLFFVKSWLKEKRSRKKKMF